MADNTNVGGVSISLDLDVSSNLESQVSKVAEQIGKKFNDNLSKGDTGKSISDDLIKNLTTAINNVEKKMSQKFDALINEATKAGKKIGSNLSSGIEQGTDASTAKISDPKVAPVKRRAGPKIDSVITKDDLIDQRDVQIGLQETLDQQIRMMQAKIREIELKPDWIKTGDVQGEILSLETKINSLIGKTQALTIDIRSLDQAIDSFDANQAIAAQEQMEAKAESTRKALSKQTLETERLERSQNQTAASAERLARAQAMTAQASEKVKESQIKNATATEKLNQTQLKTAAASERLKQSQMRTQKMMDDSDKTTKKASKSLVNMGSFSRSLARNLLGMNLILSLVAKGVRALAQGLWNSLKTNDQFNNSLQQIKSNLATAFQPIFNAIMPAINALMSALSKLTAYIAGFMSALFGKSVKASNASAKAMANAKAGVEGYSSAVKEAQKITAGFDQLNDITEQPDAGGGGGGGAGGEIIPVNLDEADIGLIEKTMSKIKGIIKKTFGSAPVKAFTNLVVTFFTEMQASLSRIGGAISTNFINMWTAMWPHLNVALLNVAEIWTNVFNDLADFISEWFPKITDQIVLFIDNVFSTFTPFFVLIAKMWEDWTKIILELWNKYGKRILDGIGEFITGALDTFNKIWTHIIDPIIQPAIEFMADIWNDHLKDILFQIGDFIGNAIARALEFYNEFIKPIIDWLVIHLGPVFSAVFTLIGGTVSGVLGSMLTTVSNIIGAIRRVFDGFMTFLEGVFSGDWQKVWQGMSDIFGGIFEGLKAIFKAPINWIIGGINGFISGLNKIKIPDWVPGVGGKGFNVGFLTPLATGGVLTEPTPALVAEYPGARSNPEIVTPQNIMRDTFRDVMSEFMLAFSGGNGMNGISQGSIDLVVNIGGMKLLDMIIDLAEEYTKQTGKKVIING